jgi:hypothetical protein
MKDVPRIIRQFNITRAIRRSLSLESLGRVPFKPVKKPTNTGAWALRRDIVGLTSQGTVPRIREGV